MFASMRAAFGRGADLVLAGAMVGILIVLFSPISPRLLDVLIIANVAFALQLLLLTFFMAKPVEFSTFPSMLLIATLFRLSLNVAATRLIFHDADAGRVINAVGSYVVGGNYVIGLVVFVILVVVQYVVVTSGAQRVAEVAARFTLDSIPGQQMSIDADLNMGFIDQVEAQRRRANLQKEANFYGAMDGASKFVKGDAIAGIIILIVDIIGGLGIGIGQNGMPWDEALRTYTLLTIGDGIVTQVPALVIAVGTGIIVTRSASDEGLTSEVSRQVLSFPRALAFVALALLGVALLPGIPTLPTLAILTIVLGLWWFARHRDALARSQTAGDAKSAKPAAAGEFDALLAVDPVLVRVGRDLLGMFQEGNSELLERIATFRKQYAGDSGFVTPEVRVGGDPRVPPRGYQILFYGVAVGQGELELDHLLAIHPGPERRKLPGRETRDPTYGLPAVWIARDEREGARAAGYTLVDPQTVFVTHLTETVKRNASMLLTRSETDRLLSRVRRAQPGLVEELVPSVLTVSDVQRVLQNLLREHVPIRNLDLILEELVDRGRATKDTDELTEHVRARLGAVICQSLLGAAGDLQVLTLDPAVEGAIATGVRNASAGTAIPLEPRFAEQVLARTGAQVEQMVKRNIFPVMLCAPELRRHLRRLTERVIPHLSVMSMSEVPNNVTLRSFGVVTV